MKAVQICSFGLKYWTTGARAFQGILSNMCSWCRWRDFLGILWQAKEKKCYFKKLLCLTALASMLFCLVLSRWSKRLLNCCESGRLLNCSWKPRGGGLPYKMDGVVIGNFEESLRGKKILFCGRGLNFFTLKRHELWKFYFEVKLRTLFIVFRTILVQSFRIFYWNITWVNVRL